MEKWKELKKTLSTKKRAVILSHRSPDGDSIGSSLAMFHYLNTFIDEVVVVIPDPAPSFLSWLNGTDQIINYVEHKEKVIQAIHEADLFCCLDFNTPHRMGEVAKHFAENKDAYILNVDHHQNPDDFADFQLSDVKASSTAQLIFELISNLGDRDKIQLAIAEAIYTGIITDTGSFRFSSTTKKTHEIAAELIEIGVNTSQVHQAVYDNYSVDRIKLLGYALNEKLKIYPALNAGIIYLTEKELSRYNFQKGDTEGLVNYPLSVGSIQLAVLITEKDGLVKLSFRSKGNFKVNELAAQYFKGGGHNNAAGGISHLNVEETLKKLEKALHEYAENN